MSFNLHPLNTDPATVLAGLGINYDLVYAWDATGGHPSGGNWMKFARGVGFGDTLLALDETMGFWIHITASSNVTLNVVGSIPTTTNIALLNDVGGWNLVGYPALANGNLPAVLSTINFSLVYAYHAADPDQWKLYDVAAPSWSNDLAYLSPGWGYWIQVGADGTWTVANP